VKLIRQQILGALISRLLVVIFLFVRAYHLLF